MTNTDKAFDEILNEAERVFLDAPDKEQLKIAVWSLRPKLQALLNSEVEKARKKELKLMLAAEYSAGAFANPTEALNHFLKVTPLIASYVLRDRLHQLNQGEKNG